MTLPRYVGVGLVIVGVVVTTMACDGTEAGTPSASSSGSDSGSSASGPTEAPFPPVAEPLDPTPWLSQPCRAIPAEELSGLGLAEGAARNKAASAAAESCVWKFDDDSGNSVDLSVMTENQNGLNDVYRTSQDNELLEKLRIAGYPALHATVFDDREDGYCGLWVGVNDSEVIFIHVILLDGPESNDPCGYADRVGEVVVANLKG